MSLRRHLGATLVVACALLAVPAFAGKQDARHHLTTLAKRTAFAGFSLPDLDGTTHTVEDLRGKVAIVNFWAVWCPPCRKEMPSLERLRAHLADQAFSVVAVAQGETANSVHEYLETLQPAPKFLYLLDTDWEATSACGVRGLPMSFVLDKKGRVAYQAVGEVEFDHPEVVRVIEALLRE